MHERTYIAPGGKTRLTSIKRVQEYCVLRGIPIPLPNGESSGDEGEVWCLRGLLLRESPCFCNPPLCGLHGAKQRVPHASARTNKTNGFCSQTRLSAWLTSGTG